MLRALLLLLLLANALLLAANLNLLPTLAGLGAAQREPERLQRQQQPELLQVLPAAAASAALRAAAASATEARATVCLEAGPFVGADVEAAERGLREAGIAGTAWQAIRAEGNGVFLIYMGRYTERELLLKKLEQVKRLRLDVDELRDAPAELRPGLSLGRFGNQAAAEAALARMVQRGLRSAKVVMLAKPQSQTLLRLPAADGTLREALAKLALPQGGQFSACPSDGEAPAAAAAAATATSASAAASGASR